MSSLSQFAGGGVKQIITGYIANVAPTSVSGGTAYSEDYFYYDLTHGGTVNTSKCVVIFSGLSHYSGQSPMVNHNPNNAIYYTRVATSRLTSSTNIRFAAPYDVTIGNTSPYYHFTGRFTIIEYY